MQAQGPVDRSVSNPSLDPDAITPGPPAEELAAAMDIPADDLVSADIGDTDSRGTGVEDTPLGDFFPTAGNSFAILSTGFAESADDDDTNNGEKYKDPSSEKGNKSILLGGLNNPQDNDLVQLTLVLDPPSGATGLNFDFAFYSEEFPGYIESSFNDAFLAELGKMPFGSQITIVGNEISSPNNFALDDNDDVVSVNIAFGFDPGNPNPDTGTTYDGTSGLLTATGCLPEGLEEGDNVGLILSITDLGDSALDSAVFLDNFQWGYAEDCKPIPIKPTAISLVSFNVEANDGRAMIMWETGTELDNAGFNLYRAASLEGPWTKINTSLIVAEGDPLSGASYTFVDMPGRGNFYYRLEDVDYFGLSTEHDPVLAELGAAIRVPWFRPFLPEF
jgi:hypothetical protein